MSPDRKGITMGKENKHGDPDEDRQQGDGQVDAEDVPSPREPKPNPHSDE